MSNRISALASLFLIYCFCLTSVAAGQGIFVEALGGDSNDGANCIIETADGGIVIAGTAREPTSAIFFVAKFDGNGELLWETQLCGCAHGVVESSSGEYLYVVGSTSRSSGDTDFHIVKLRASDGISLERKRWYHADYDDCFHDVLLASDGTIWATGYTDGLQPGDRRRVVVARIDSDMENMHVAWAGRWDMDLTGTALTEVFGTDGFCVTGRIESGINDVDILLAKFGPDLHFSFSKRIEHDAIGSTYQEYGTDILRTSDGELAITGYFEDANNGRSGLLLKLDSNAHFDWARMATGPQGYEKTLEAVVETPQGLATLGNRARTGQAGVTLTQWTLAGSLIWNRTFDSMDYAVARALSRRGNAGFLSAGIASAGMGEDDVCIAVHNAWGHTCLEEISGPSFSSIGFSVGTMVGMDSSSFTAPLSWYGCIPMYYPVEVTEICAADTLHVCPDGSGDYTLIQDALDAASHCDVIELCDETFTDQGDLDFQGKSVVLRSESGDPAACVIDLSGLYGLGALFHGNEDPTTVLEGIQIANSDGAGISCFESQPTIRNCWIVNCGWDQGLAITCEFLATPRFENCCVFDNPGSGISCHGSDPVFSNCTIADNMDNGIECMYSSPQLDRCILAFNDGFGVLCYTHEPPPPPSAPFLSCCDVYGNDAGDWVGCIEGQAGERYNFSADPRLCRELNPEDPYSIWRTSPCASVYNPDCGLVGARPVGCDPEEEICIYLGRFVDDAYLSRTFGTPPHHTDEFTIGVLDGGVMPVGIYPLGYYVCFMMNMQRIIWDAGGRPGIDYFGEIARFNPLTGELASSVTVPDSYTGNLGLAVEPEPGIFNCTYWYTRSGYDSLYAMDQDGAAVGSYPAFSDSITGLAFDPQNDHLWCIARGVYDRLAEYDVSSGTPELIQGPMEVQWSGRMQGGGAAGLAYNTDDDGAAVLVAIDARTGAIVHFLDCEPDYPGPPGESEPGVWQCHVCTTIETPAPWGVAVRAGEQTAYVAGNPADRPRPIDKYMSRTWSDVEDRDSTPSIPWNQLSQNYPNPFSLVTTIRYELPRAGHVRLEVFDLAGRKMATLVDAQQQGGPREARWVASEAASGIYFYVLSADDNVFTKKAILVK